MSDFASLLSSFKQNASSAASAAAPKKSSATSNSTQSRKRPLPTNNTSSALTSVNHFHSIPHFPSLHHGTRKETDFQLKFLGIGAQKAGTTWLHKLLQKCHLISLPQKQKEVHFWDWHHRKGIEWYIQQFRYSPQNSSSYYGEITPCYAVLPEQTIAEISKCFPNLKIIFIARDLVDRAWSAMIMELRDQTMGLNAGEFADGVVGSDDKNTSKRTKLSASQQRRLQQQSSPSSQPDSYFMDRLRNTTHDSRSNYAKYLSNWYKHFPSESILLLDYYRDIESDPRSVLMKVVMHIGVEEEKAKQFVDTAVPDTNATASSASSSHHLLTQRPHLKKQMEIYLQPYATEFNTLLQAKGYDWRLDEYNDSK
ncbi:hypothetical protein ACHAWC_001874 [Mediolabrus comicus]